MKILTSISKIFISLSMIAVFFTANINMYSFTYPTITTINPTIKSIMEKVNINYLENNIRYLQNLGPRPALDTAPNYQNNVAAKNWLYQQYQNTGNLDVYFNHFLPAEKCDTVWDWISDTAFLTVDTALNVVAVQKGTIYPDEYIIVCAHFDTGPDFGPRSDNFISPGAEDNASGSSAVIEIARILSNYKFKRSIIYLNTNCEEIGLLGARVFACCSRENNINILGVFNLDMIGYIPPFAKGLEIFYDTILDINNLNNNNVISTTREFGKYFGQVANLYLPDIPTMPGLTLGGADCFNFRLYDYPAMYIGDVLGAFRTYITPCYHQECNTIGIGIVDAGVNSMELVKAYTQATLVAISELAELEEVHITEDNSIGCRITPNPTNNTATLTLDLEKSGNLQITLTNSTGQEVMQIHNAFTNTETFTKTFSIKTLPQGIYFLNINHNGKVIVEKIVKN